MRNQTRWNIYFSNRLWKPRLWHNLKINFLMRHDARGRFGQKRTGTRKFKRCATFFSEGRGGKEKSKWWKRWRTWEEGEEERGRRSRFTFYEVNWMGSSLPLPSSCRKITYNDGGGTEPMEAQNGYYLRRRRHSWLSFWFTSCPLDLILASTTRSTPPPPPPPPEWLAVRIFKLRRKELTSVDACFEGRIERVNVEV